MNTKTMGGKTLAEWLQSPACAELDAVAHELATGDDLRAREEDIPGIVGQVITELCVTLDFSEVGAGQKGETDRQFFDRFYKLVWEKRSRHPYGDALESAVEAWRRPVPKYSTDGNAMLDLIDAMLKRGLVSHVRTAKRHTPKAYAFVYKQGLQVGCGEAETLPLAVTRAAIAVLCNKDTK